MTTCNLITGSTGFIGQRLIQPNDRALVRSESSHKNFVIGNILDRSSLRLACDGIDTVFHCAGYPHAFISSNQDAHWRVNFEGTLNLLVAAGEAGVRRFVFLSSTKAMAEPGNECINEDCFGNPKTPYGRAKRLAEEAVLEFGMKFNMHVVNLRLAMVYGRGGLGNLERMAHGIKAGWFPPLPETSNRRSLVHVNDVVAVARFVAKHPRANGKTYIVADPVAYSGKMIYDTIREVLGFPPIRWRVPETLLRGLGRLGGSRGGEVIDRLLGSACYSPEKIEQELNWHARVGLVEGLQEMLGK